MKLFIGCSSSNDIPQKYLDDCKKYLDELFKENNDLVFGASNRGIMGLCVETALNHNKEVIGISPEVYKEDFNSLECTKEIVTNSISRRTDALIALSDAIIFLPGGIGTIYEFLATIESKRGKEFDKPIIIYNSCHYFDTLLTFLDKIYKEQFTSELVANCYHISPSAKETLEYIKNYYNKTN